MIKKYIYLFVLLCFVSRINASNYYFSTSTGNDSRTSAQAKNPATPWKTVAKLNSIFSTLLPGDSVLFNKGEIFDGGIIISKSGSAASPIILSAYGTGAKPIINGLSKLTTWINKGANIWESSCASCGTSVNIMVINGSVQAMGRFPNSNAANKGYLTFQSHVGTTQITDANLPATPNWTGAELVLRSAHWILDRDKITNHSGTTINYTAVSTYVPINNFGYFIQNHIATLDQNKEWFYDATAHKMELFFTSNPSSLTIEVPIVDTLVKCFNKSNIVFDRITFKGSNINTFVVAAASTKIIIRNCNILFAGTDAVLVNSNNFTFANDTIANTNNNALVVNGNNTIITNNTLLNTGLWAGMGKSKDGNYYPLSVSGTKTLVQFNNIDSAGYLGINFAGDSVTIKNNFINHFAMVKDDAGGISTWTGPAGTSGQTRLVDHNIILNGIGANEGTTSTVSTSTNGIYMDDNTANVTITGNTVANCASGIYLHNLHANIINDNTTFDNSKQQLKVIHQNATCPACVLQNNTITNNIFFAKLPSELVADIESDVSNDIGTFGTFDNNYYCRPLADNFDIFNLFVSAGQTTTNTFDLQGWQAAYSKDLASHKSPVQIPIYTLNSLIGSNKFSNETFTSAVSGVNCFSSVGNCSTTWNSGGQLDAGCLQFSFTSSTANISSLMVGVGAVDATKNYILKFSLKGTKSIKPLAVFLRQTLSPFNILTPITNFKISNTRAENEFLFSAPITESNASIVFQIDSKDSLFWMDNLKLFEANVTMTDPDAFIRFEFNPTSITKTVSLSGAWANCQDVKGTTYSGSLTLAPYSSIIVIKDVAGVGIASAELPSTYFNIYPNPASTELNIVCNEPIKKVQIFDLSGKLILLTANNKQSLINIPVADIPAGFYFISITLNNGQVSSKKFVKQ
jgi:parallel beta-helix repeat protein